MKTTFLILGWIDELKKVISPDYKKSEDPIDSKNLLEWETKRHLFIMRKDYPILISCNKRTGERQTLVSALYYFANGLHKTPADIANDDGLLDIYSEWKKISRFKFIEIETPETAMV